MAIARFPSVVIDCPDPGALATFYAALLDWEVDASSDWADIALVLEVLAPLPAAGFDGSIS